MKSYEGYGVLVLNPNENHLEVERPGDATPPPAATPEPADEPAEKRERKDEKEGKKKREFYEKYRNPQRERETEQTPIRIGERGSGIGGESKRGGRGNEERKGCSRQKGLGLVRHKGIGSTVALGLVRCSMFRAMSAGRGEKGRGWREGWRGREEADDEGESWGGIARSGDLRDKMASPSESAIEGGGNSSKLKRSAPPKPLLPSVPPSPFSTTGSLAPAQPLVGRESFTRHSVRTGTAGGRETGRKTRGGRERGTGFEAPVRAPAVNVHTFRNNSTGRSYLRVCQVPPKGPPQGPMASCWGFLPAVWTEEAKDLPGTRAPVLQSHRMRSACLFLCMVSLTPSPGGQPCQQLSPDRGMKHLSECAPSPPRARLC
ncbi:unnamed protein product [Boreogadus saida]